MTELTIVVGRDRPAGFPEIFAHERIDREIWGSLVARWERTGRATRIYGETGGLPEHPCYCRIDELQREDVEKAQRMARRYGYRGCY